MRRNMVVVACLTLVVAACNPGGGPVGEPRDGPTTTQASSGQVPPASQPDGQTSTTDVGETTTTSDRPVAPDFTLTLGDGGSYTLSEGTKPVYLVFWAEW